MQWHQHCNERVQILIFRILRRRTQNQDCIVGMLVSYISCGVSTGYILYKNDLVAKYIFSLQQVSREEGEETTATTPTLQQRESPDFVSLEEDTTVGERREGRLERENFRLKEQVPVKLF